jgi:hypothetical protein
MATVAACTVSAVSDAATAARFAFPQSVIDQVVIAVRSLNVVEIIVKVQGSERCCELDLFGLSHRKVEARDSNIDDVRISVKSAKSVVSSAGAYTRECGNYARIATRRAAAKAADLVIDANSRRTSANHGRRGGTAIL